MSMFYLFLVLTFTASLAHIWIIRRAIRRLSPGQWPTAKIGNPSLAAMPAAATPLLASLIINSGPARLLLPALLLLLLAAAFVVQFWLAARVRARMHAADMPTHFIASCQRANWVSSVLFLLGGIVLMAYVTLPLRAVTQSYDAPAAAQVAKQPPRPRLTELPPELQPLAAKIDASVLHYARGVAQRATSTQPWESSLGGTAYLPQGAEYPRDSQGKPMALLAQIDLSTLPAIPDFPTEGMLQFFVAEGESRDHIWGMSMYDERPFDARKYFQSLQDQRHFRVVYHPTVSRDPGALAQAPRPSGDFLPVHGQATLKFEADSEPVAHEDYRFKHIFGKDAHDFFAQFGQDADRVSQDYLSYSTELSFVKLGGYARVVQEDPRNSAAEDDWLLLLAIESGSFDGGIEGVMWGDAGVGCWFIRRADLLNRDFTKVAYYWDNH